MQIDYSIFSLSVISYACLQIYLWSPSSLLHGPGTRQSASDPVAQALDLGPKAACNALTLQWLPSLQSTAPQLHAMLAYDNGAVMHHQTL